MKGKLILGVLVLLFSSFSCFAQSSTNDQRIVGTWVNVSTIHNRNTGTDTTITQTLVFNANGSGTFTNSRDNTTNNFTYGVSVNGRIMIQGDYNEDGEIYFSPDGRVMYIKYIMYRKR